MQGKLVALDKSTAKIEKIKKNLEMFNISCVHCFKYDATKSFSEIEKSVGGFVHF